MKNDIQTDLEAERFERILIRSASFKEQHASKVINLTDWLSAPSRLKPLASAAAVQLKKAGRPVL
jgi:hypothetical protein